MFVVMKTTMLLFCDVDEVKLYFAHQKRGIIYKLCNQKIPQTFNNISENKTGYSNMAFLLNLCNLFVKIKLSEELHTGGTRSSALIPEAWRTTIKILKQFTRSPGKDLISQFLIRSFVDSLHAYD